MANRFHFNPATGRTGRCEAKTADSCQFGQSEDQHGATEEEARANYEAHMEPQLFANTTAPLTSPDLPKGIDPTPRDPSTMAMSEIPEGMHRITMVSGTNIRDYERSADPRFQKDLYIGGKHRIMEGARSIRVSDGSKVWAVPVMTGGTRGTLFFPMRQLIPVAVKYSPEALAYQKEQEERDRAHWADFQVAEAARNRQKVMDRLQQERISSTPYEELSVEDQVVANRMRTEQEEKRWAKDPEPILYSGPNRHTKGHISENGKENSVLNKLRGIPDYDLMDYNNRVESLAASDMPREEQERLIREERMNYISSMNSLLDRQAASARTIRTRKPTFKATLRSFFQRDKADLYHQKMAEDQIRYDRKAIHSFAEKFFEAPLYARVIFEKPRRRF